MTYRDIHHYIVNQISPRYPQAESSEIAYRIIEAYYSMSKIDIALSSTDAVNINPKIKAAITQLVDGEPLQYVLGHADFYDLSFEVNPSVLIPRPETEELVALVLENLPNSHIKLLDIGTGSACIPVSIKKNKPFVDVSACDVSPAALDVARRNATNNGVEVEFFEIDILRDTLTQHYDVIVSNPPYVTPSEKESMRTNVLDFEPHLALFIEESEPLLFYKRIADIGLAHLTEGGYLFFEINELFGNEICHMLTEKSYVNVTLYQDIYGKDRMIMAQKPHK